MDGARRRELREVGREDRGRGSRQGSRKRVRNMVGTGKSDYMRMRRREMQKGVNTKLRGKI